MRSGTRKVTTKKIKATESSGNVFRDLGLRNPEELMAKAEVTRQIANVLRKKGITQAQAAVELGIPQPKISRLLRGYWEGFSMDRLLRILNVLGHDVEIVIRSQGSKAARTTVSVVA